jgi:hypothetical protein
MRAQDTSNFASKNLVFRNALLVGVNYSRQRPIGILSNRFGDNSSVGFSLTYKFSRNFQIQGSINTLFGSVVNENTAFDTMIGKGGYMLDVNGNYAEVKMYERGYNWHFDIGKIFPLGKFDRNSGLLVSVGAGFIQHKIKYTFQRNVLPQLEGEYAKGYDRLTNGLMLRGFVGYQRIAENKMFNFIAGLEFLNGHTRSRRAFDYDTRRSDKQSRIDNLLGLKLGVMINIGDRQTGVKKGEEDRYFD